MEKEQILEALRDILQREEFDKSPCKHLNPIEISGKKLDWIVCEDCESLLACADKEINI